MTVGHVYNHFILHTQQIFTMALTVSLSLVFGNFATAKSATIPTVYREELLGISVAGLIIILISLIYDIFSDIKSKFTMEEIFKDLKFWHHLICFIFIAAVVGIVAVYLNRGNIPYDISLSLSIVSGLISVFTFAVIIYCFRKTLMSRRNVYEQAISNFDTQRRNALVG